MQIGKINKPVFLDADSFERIGEGYYLTDSIILFSRKIYNGIKFGENYEIYGYSLKDMFEVVEVFEVF